MNAPEIKSDVVKEALKHKTVDIQPKPRCKKCYGTGRIGLLNGDKNQPLPCSCVVKQVRALEAKQKVDKDTQINMVTDGSSGPAGDTSERK